MTRGSGGGRTTVAREIAPEVYCLGPLGRVQNAVYFVRSGASWVLIDAGWASDGSRIELAAEALFGADARPAAILLTHCHPDHAGSALRLARAWDCGVHMHPDELPIASGDFAAMQACAGPIDRFVVLPLMRAMTAPSAVVVGAGVGGLSAAIHLARRGMRVTVVEKNRGPGGRVGQFTRDGHTFSTGPTLLIMPLLYRSELARLGVDMDEALEAQRVDPTYDIVFDDGARLAMTSDLVAMRSQLEAMEPGAFGGLLRYIEEGRRHYHLAMPALVDRDFRRVTDFATPANALLALRIKALLPHYRHMSRFFDSPRLRAAFTYQDVYMGLSPFSAPSTFSLTPYSELAHGVWYPKGGMYRIVEVLAALAEESGVTFAYDEPVRRIAIEGDRASGVVLDGGLLPADVVVANADLPYVYRRLLPDRAAAEAMGRKTFSGSTISFFWGLDRVYPELRPHTLFLGDAYRDNFDRIERNLPVPDGPSVYVHAPTRLDPGTAPAGKDTLIAVVPTGHMTYDGDDAERIVREEEAWVAERERARGAVLARLAQVGIHDVAAHITVEATATPPTWRARHNLERGATHGLAHTLFQLAYLRPHNRHARYRNLYFAGASTHPGTGVPTALVSGRLAAERIADDLHP